VTYLQQFLPLPPPTPQNVSCEFSRFLKHRNSLVFKDRNVILLWPFDPKDETAMMSRNVGNRLPSDAAPYSRRTQLPLSFLVGVLYRTYKTSCVCRSLRTRQRCVGRISLLNIILAIKIKGKIYTCSLLIHKVQMKIWTSLVSLNMFFTSITKKTAHHPKNIAKIIIIPVW
jgi:hypothetical protein